MTFSKRMGIVPEKKPLQLNDMDKELRQELHNNIRLFEESFGDERSIKPIYRFLWSHFYIMSLDDFNDDYYWYECKQQLNSLYYSLEWYRVYDYIEEYLLFAENSFHNKCNSLLKYISYTLERHNSGYRIVEGKFISITNDTELEELSQAANTGLKAVDHHMKQAIAIFS